MAKKRIFLIAKKIVLMSVLGMVQIFVNQIFQQTLVT